MGTGIYTVGASRVNTNGELMAIVLFAIARAHSLLVFSIWPVARPERILLSEWHMIKCIFRAAEMVLTVFITRVRMH